MSKLCCPYHAIIEALDAFGEAHSPVNVDDVIDALITIAAEPSARESSWRSVSASSARLAATHPILKH
jgi:hypothetical protein